MSALSAQPTGPTARLSRAAPFIVHIVEHMAPGGIETLVLDMARGLPGRHTVFSLAATRRQLIEAWPRLAEMPARLEAFGRHPGVHPTLVVRLARRLHTLAPDAVIVHHDGPLVYGGLAARLARVPVLLHVEHDAWHYSTPQRRALAKILFRIIRPRRVAVSSEIAAVVADLAPSPAHVIAPGIDLAVYKPGDRADARARLGLRLDVPIIGTSGRLVAVKDQASLIRALATLRTATTAAPELVIVGEGPERAALLALSQALGVRQAVHLLGHRDDLPSILPAFDVYALPSLNEGLPRGVLEAQAVGLPVVASCVGGLPKAVCPVSGRLVPPSDPHALAVALAERLAHPTDPAVPRAFVDARFALTRTLAAFSAALQPVPAAITAETLACGI